MTLRSNVVDMTDKTIGRFRIVGISDRPKSYKETAWICKCQDCGHERIQRGNLLRKTVIQCPNCDANPCRHKVSNWSVRLASLKRQLRHELIYDTNPREIERLAAAVAYAYRKRDGRK